MKLIKLISIADIFTLTNGVIGMFAILYLIDKNYTATEILLFIAIIMDGLDGITARYFKSKHSFGIYLDSIADSISFCFAPTALIYSIYYDTSRGTSFEDSKNALTVICCSCLFILGMIRLARFTYSRQNKLKTFVGLPTPALTFFIVCMIILIPNKLYYFLPITIMVSILMIMEIKYPKIRGKLAIVGLVAILLGILGVIYKDDYHNIFCILALIFITLYIVGSPFIAKVK